MSKRLFAILLALPVLTNGLSSAFAASQAEPESASPTLAAPAHEHAAMPAGCNGCAGHDCANCPLAMAAAAQTEQAPAPAAEIPCGAK